MLGFGGSGALARSLMHTRLGGLRGPDPSVGERRGVDLGLAERGHRRGRCGRVEAQVHHPPSEGHRQGVGALGVPERAALAHVRQQAHGPHVLVRHPGDGERVGVERAEQERRHRVAGEQVQGERVPDPAHRAARRLEAARQPGPRDHRQQQEPG